MKINSIGFDGQPYTFTNDEGVTVTFASQAAYEAAADWYNAHSKDEMRAYCLAHGVSIDANSTHLCPGWADIAMECWAKHDYRA